MSNILRWFTDLGQKPADEQVAFIAKLPSGMLTFRKKVSDLMDSCEKAFGSSGVSVFGKGKRCIDRIVAKKKEVIESESLDNAKKALESDLESHSVLIASLKDVKEAANAWTVFNVSSNIDNVILKFTDLEESGDRIVADMADVHTKMFALTRDTRKKDSQDKVNSISITKNFIFTGHIGKLMINWMRDMQALPSDNKVECIPLEGYEPSSPVVHRFDGNIDYRKFLSEQGQVSFDLDAQGYPLEFVQSWNLLWTMHHKNI